MATVDPVIQTNQEISLDERKLQLERERFEYERQRHVRDDASILRKGAIVVTIVGTILAMVVSLSQFFLQRHNAGIEGDLLKEKNERDWKLQAVKIILDNDKKLFSQDKTDRAIAISIIKTALPIELYNSVLGIAAGESKSSEARDQLRTAQDLGPGVGSFVSTTLVSDVASPKKEKKIIGDEPILYSVTATPISDRQFRFTVGVTSNSKNKDKIKNVKYEIAHPTFKTKNYESSNIESNFSMSYVGWGAVDEINTIVNFRDGTSQIGKVNMIRELGW